MSNIRSIPLKSTPLFFKKEAKKLLKQYRENNPLATDLFAAFHSKKLQAKEAKLSDAQRVIARHYGQRSWTKLLEKVNANKHFQAVLKAFDSCNPSMAEKIIRQHPILLERNDLLKHAVRYEYLEMVKRMYYLGAGSVQNALGQTIYSRLKEIADFLISVGGKMEKGDQWGAIGLSACELYNVSSLSFALSYYKKPIDENVLFQFLSMLLCTYSRNPQAKHECIELLIQQGLRIPETPMMAFHQGRIDLLKMHLQRDPSLLNHRFSLTEIFPSAFGIQPGDGLHLTPVDGATLLHLAIEYDEQAIMQWLVENGADVDAQAGTDADGFGGHTPLFHTTVSFTPHDTFKVSYLLKHGADPNHRCTIKKQLKYTGKRYLEDVYEFHHVTPISFARQFQIKNVISEGAIKVIKQYGGKETT